MVGWQMGANTCVWSAGLSVMEKQSEDVSESVLQSILSAHCQEGRPTLLRCSSQVSPLLSLDKEFLSPAF